MLPPVRVRATIVSTEPHRPELVGATLPIRNLELPDAPDNIVIIAEFDSPRHGRLYSTERHRLVEGRNDIVLKFRMLPGGAGGRPPAGRARGQGWIEGYVTDDKGKAISGAYLFIATTGERIQANNLGYYRLPHDPTETLPLEYYKIVCTASRHDTEEKTINLQPGQNILEFKLKPLAGPPPPEPLRAPTNLRAHAISDTQIDLTWDLNTTDEDGAVVRISGGGNTWLEPLVGHGLTSHSVLGLHPATTYHFNVRVLRGTESSPWSATVTAKTLDEPPSENAWIDVWVKDDQGRLLDNADVYVLSTGDHNTTDHTGFCRIPHDPAHFIALGTHKVVCGHAGYEGDDKIIKVVPGQNVLEFHLKSREGKGDGWIEGYVNDEKGDPIEHADITEQKTGNTTRTDTHGHFRIPENDTQFLPIGFYKVVASKTGYKDEGKGHATVLVDPKKRPSTATLELKSEGRARHRGLGDGVLHGQVWIKNAQGRDVPFNRESGLQGSDDVRSRNRVYIQPTRFGRLTFEGMLEAEIDDYGRYIFVGIEPGFYNVACKINDPLQEEWKSEAHHTPQPTRYPMSYTDVKRFPLRVSNDHWPVYVHPTGTTKHDFHFYPHGGTPWARGANTARNWIEQRWGMGVLANLPALAFVMIGFLISNYYHNMNFLWGFLSLGMYFLLPEPIQGRFQQELAEGHIRVQVKLSDLFPSRVSGRWQGPRTRDREQFNNAVRWLVGNNSSTWSMLRSAAKTSALWFFTQGLLQHTFVFSNLLLFIMAFVAYFSFKLEYDTRNPGEFIESVWRFGFLGAYIIPWVIFAQVFDSLVLGLVAFAFFAVPPVPKREQQSEVEVASTLAMMEKFFFLFVMFLALVWSGALASVFPFLSGPGLFGSLFVAPAGWNLKGPLADTFFFFWMIYTIAGFFSPPQERPAAGFIMLGASTIIYAVGPGTQEVGQGLLGPYFPAFYKGLIGFAKPFSNAFSSIGSAFAPAFMLLINPVGYAQNITQGIYSSPDAQTGITGAFGVEIEDFKAATRIFTEQPYMLSLKLNNKGSFNARNVNVTFAAGEKAPEIEKGYKTPLVWNVVLHGRPKKRDIIDLTELGFIDRPEDSEGREGLSCAANSGRVIACFRNITSFMDKMLILPVLFQSEDKGITCPVVNKYELKEKFLPFTAVVSYDYDISSSLDIEFISDAEWRRKAQADELVQLERKPATLSNAPVMLNIDTFEQPIKENVAFPLRIQLATGPRGGSINKTYSINAEISTELWENVRYCVPGPKALPIKERSITLLVWEEEIIPPSRTIVCNFNRYKFPDAERDKKGVQPTRTFLIKANSSYRFSKGEETIEKLEWGGTPCCYPDTKYKGQSGNEFCRSIGYNKCDENEQCSAGGNPDDRKQKEPGQIDYCEEVAVNSEQAICNLGEGGCKSDTECCTESNCPKRTKYDVTGDNMFDELSCRKGVASGVCCPTSATDDECTKAHDMWLEKKSGQDVADFLLNSYLQRNKSS